MNAIIFPDIGDINPTNTFYTISFYSIYLQVAGTHPTVVKRVRRTRYLPFTYTCPIYKPIGTIHSRYCYVTMPIVIVEQHIPTIGYLSRAIACL